MVIKDTNDLKEVSKSRYSSLEAKNKEKFKDIYLRPNKDQMLRKNITSIFQTINEEKQKSNKSRSSERLSRKDRNKVRDEIFGDKDLLPSKQEFEEMKIVEEQGEDEVSEEETEYQFEYIEE